MINPNLALNEALKVESLCGRVLGDIGSIHARITTVTEDNQAAPMSPELVALRRYIREIQDAVRDLYPNDFYK
jgi:hypothetical protein